jgi:hypothetical protein
MINTEFITKEWLYDFIYYNDHEDDWGMKAQELREAIKKHQPEIKETSSFIWLFNIRNKMGSETKKAVLAKTFLEAARIMEECIDKEESEIIGASMITSSEMLRMIECANAYHPGATNEQ